MRNQEMAASVRSAIGAHGAWKLKLKIAIATGRIDADPAKVRCDDQCDFGRWLYSAGIDPATRAGMPYKVVRRLHAEFHDCAGRVLTLALSDQKARATAIFESEYEERSSKLVRALMKWRGELQLEQAA